MEARNGRRDASRVQLRDWRSDCSIRLLRWGGFLGFFILDLEPRASVVDYEIEVIVS